MRSICTVPCYFGSISYFYRLFQAKNIFFETDSIYYKQTDRSRCHILSASGIQILTIPIEKPYYKRPFKDIRISYDSDWIKLHKATLQTAYGSSPYYMYIKDQIYDIYDTKYTYLIDINMRTIQWVFDILQRDITYSYITYSDTVDKDVSKVYISDRGKKNYYINQKYSQVMFDTIKREVFVPNLSILDMLCNVGNATDDLEKGCYMFYKK